MRLIPNELDASLVTSSERRVHEALRASTLAGTALHSLNLPEHQYKLTAELDFVLVLESLVLAIEVKGGQLACRDGLWTYSDRAGHFRQSSEGPFKQVSTGMYALRERMCKRLGDVMDGVAFGYLVVTPDVNLVPSFEWDAETYCGHSAFGRGIDKAIGRAVSYWQAKQPQARRIDSGTRSRLVQELRPDFDRSPLLDARARSLDVEFSRLTDEQYSRLDIVLGAPRILCTGGAGTGKTLLAEEASRRLAMAGSSVLFVCRSEVLAARVRAELASTTVKVAAAAELAGLTQFDVLVVDEAQDLMNFESLELLDRLLKGGWQEGRWVIFMDQNHQSHLFGDFDSEALAFVESLGPVPASLSRNCRNTRQIAFQTRALTGADTGIDAAGAGPEVVFIPVDSAEDEAGYLDAHLRRLSEEGIERRSIAILSFRGDWETSAARLTKAHRKNRLQKLDARNVNEAATDQITWSPVVDFKGLENLFVCIIDVDTLSSDVELNLLYVALSRPRAGLWVALRRELNERIRELYRLHALAARDALGK